MTADVFQGPEALLRFDALLEGLTGLGKLLYSQLWFVTVAGHRLKSARGSSAPCGVQETPGTSFRVPLPAEPYRQCQVHVAMGRDGQRSSLEPWCLAQP